MAAAIDRLAGVGWEAEGHARIWICVHPQRRRAAIADADAARSLQLNDAIVLAVSDNDGDNVPLICPDGRQIKTRLCGPSITR
jgi:hypothetical protein